MLRRLNRLEPVGKFRSEPVGDFGDHRISLTAIEHVLDEGPLEHIPRSVTSWLDSVAPVRATHQDGNEVGVSVGSEFKALIDDGFVEFKMPPLKR